MADHILEKEKAIQIASSFHFSFLSFSSLD